MNQAFYLLQLQKIDTQLDQAAHRLEDISRLLTEDEALKQADALVLSASHMLKHARLSLQKAEEAVRAQQIKIVESEASLYSGRIKNPKELQDLQKEIAAQKRQQTVLEDQQIASMIALEESEKEHMQASAQLSAVQARFAEQKAGLLGEQTQINKNIERLQSERAALLSPIAPENLQIYLRLRAQKRGTAIATVTDKTCDGCGASLTPGEWQAARSPSKIVYCTTCGRILYAG